MELLSQRLDFSTAKPSLPKGYSEEVYEICRNISSPELAEQVLEKLQPLFTKYRADKKLAIACGLLFEKHHSEMNMRLLWDDLQNLFPGDTMALRMLMRWYRREGQSDEGIAHIHAMYPASWYSISQAKNAILGLSELKAWTEIDTIMETILAFHPRDRSVRMAYIKALSEQSRFPEAAHVARHVENRDRMGVASQDLLTMVERKAWIMNSYRRSRPTELIEDILTLAGPPRPFVKARRLVCFTGQLGTGGAERQMTRIACAYQEQAGCTGAPAPLPQVWVKHANPSKGADFYLPMLRNAGVTTRILADEPEVSINDLDGLPDSFKELLTFLAPDLLRHVGQLISMFRDHETDVAYLWQDGGIVQSAIAAVVAGVPRIVTSFRGLPPNLRPRFFRDELPILYSALARLPHVTFTANSQKTATAYEEWLSLEPGTVIVIPNAIPPVLPEGDASDHSLWSAIVSASAVCTKTVLGVFRFDDNKRPLHWIEAASRYLEKHDDTRFVMLGNGLLFDRCAARIDELGLSERIFLAGIRNNVGFYMHRADLLMHLAEMEGLPNVLIESQLAGTPVLATPAGGTDEVVEDGVTGILLSTADHLPEHELDQKLDALLSEPETLARLGTAATALSGERFSSASILDRTTNLFNSFGAAA